MTLKCGSLYKKILDFILVVPTILNKNISHLLCLTNNNKNI